jgi:hypothetical protein
MVVKAFTRASMPTWPITGKAWLCLAVILGLILTAPHSITIATSGDLDHLRAFQFVADADEPMAVMSEFECFIHFGCSILALPPANADALYVTRSLKIRGVATGPTRPLSDAPYHPPRLLPRA